MICVETGYKVYNPKQRNNNFIPNLLKQYNAILITFNHLLSLFTLNVCLFTSSIVLKHLRVYVTVFLRKTLRHNWVRIYDAYVFHKSFLFMCDYCVYMHFEMIEGSFLGIRCIILIFITNILKFQIQKRTQNREKYLIILHLLVVIILLILTSPNQITGTILSLALSGILN